MKITQKLTIHDVAARAGASASTVSAALNGTWRERRISADTAERIIALAREAGYSVNLQARGLRKARSGLVGLILPEHNNRFFSDLSQAFAAEARGRGLCPVIVATERNPQEERETVRQLIDYAIDQLFIAGAVRPEDLSQLCRENALPHVFIDQPCADAPSVVSDNREGAAALTRLITAQVSPDRRGDIVFLGGNAALNATSRRIEGFRAAMAEAGVQVAPDQVVAQSYETERAYTALERLYDLRGGHLPAGLFINSLSVFEGALRFIAGLPEDQIRACAFGCYDYEPFGALLRFPLPMVRQRHRTLIRRAYQLLEEGATGPLLEVVMPELCLPGQANVRQG
jgi:LacI family transcriptional regulator, fructose operon transcriptional repressor